jgi:hypothetical protein
VKGRHIVSVGAALSIAVTLIAVAGAGSRDRTQFQLVFRVGTATTSPINLTLRAKPPRGARSLQVELDAADVVGNSATTTNA